MNASGNRKNSTGRWSARASVAMLLCCAAAGLTYAKNIDYTPDVAAEAYWDSNHIGVIRVTSVATDDRGIAHVTYQMQRQFSQGPVETTRTVPASHFWFGVGAEDRPQLAANDRLIVFYAKEGPTPIVALKAEGQAGDSQIATLGQIAALREIPEDFPAYMASALSADAMVSRYSMGHLLEQTAPLQANGDYVAKLAQVRDDPTRGALSRLLAGRLAGRITGAGEDSDPEYTWVRSLVAGSASKEWTDLAPFVGRLLEFKNKRPETVAFLTRLATNPSEGQAVRIAAYSAFEDPRLCRFEAPDAESERIFQASMDLLKDPEPAMRSAGAALLHGMAARVNPEDRHRYVQRSKKAITEALASESDEVAQFHLGRFIELLSQ